jgi:membrane protein DedA with SNARE-associated domain
MSNLTQLISQYGLIAMFLIIMLEYACFPVSSEIVLPFSGAVAAINQIPFLLILPLSILAGLIGTGICFAVGWFGGTAILQAIKRKFPKTVKPIDSSYEKFLCNSASAVCIGRVIPLIRTYIALVAGSARMNPVTYFTSSLLGITVWNTLLIGLGYSLQSNYGRVAGYYDRYKSNLLPVIVIFIGFLIFRKVLKKVRKESVKQEKSTL